MNKDNNQDKIQQELLNLVDESEAFNPPTLDEQIKQGKIADLKED